MRTQPGRPKSRAAATIKSRRATGRRRVHFPYCWRDCGRRIGVPRRRRDRALRAYMNDTPCLERDVSYMPVSVGYSKFVMSSRSKEPASSVPHSPEPFLSVASRKVKVKARSVLRQPEWSIDDRCSWPGRPVRAESGATNLSLVARFAYGVCILQRTRGRPSGNKPPATSDPAVGATRWPRIRR